MTRNATQEERWDRDRDYRKHEFRPSDIPHSQRVVIAKLVGYCEGVTAAGVLSEDGEIQLRRLIAEACAAFDLPSKVEMADAQA